MNIVLADDHDLIREGLKAFLLRLPDIAVTGEADNGRSLIELVKEQHPHLVIMDVSMPDLNGIETTHILTRDFPSARVLGLSMHADRRFVLEMLRAGAVGYILKNRATHEIPDALEAIRKQQVYLSPQIVGMVVRDFIRQPADRCPTAFSILTEREREVLQLLAEGKSTKKIADGLSVSTKTIETHRKHIMDKLGVDSVAGLTKYAIREGLTSLDA
ncbi:MAG: response regulator transcription factor [Verrucomicrobia bacterium]|nr:response regulator transcription factor [Verrucomicrobiota bacterium]